MDPEYVEQGVLYSRRSYKRTFVYLDKEEAKATSGWSSSGRHFHSERPSQSYWPFVNCQLSNDLKR